MEGMNEFQQKTSHIWESLNILNPDYPAMPNFDREDGITAQQTPKDTSELVNDVINRVTGMKEGTPVNPESTLTDFGFDAFMEDKFREEMKTLDIDLSTHDLNSLKVNQIQGMKKPTSVNPQSIAFDAVREEKYREAMKMLDEEIYTPEVDSLNVNQFIR